MLKLLVFKSIFLEVYLERLSSFLMKPDLPKLLAVANIPALLYLKPTSLFSFLG